MRLVLCLAAGAFGLAQANAATMKAIVVHEYGGPEVLKYEDAPRPESKENEVLVRVVACGVNPADPLVVSGRMAKEFGTHLPLIPGLANATNHKTIRAGSSPRGCGLDSRHHG